jgi:hypothetical protein
MKCTCPAGLVSTGVCWDLVTLPHMAPVESGMCSQATLSFIQQDEERQCSGPVGT